jgi:hypothetical protein
MTRFVVKNTIDSAMMSMKERKQLEIDGKHGSGPLVFEIVAKSDIEVMDGSKRDDKLTVHELMELFGPVSASTAVISQILTFSGWRGLRATPIHFRIQRTRRRRW